VTPRVFTGDLPELQRTFAGEFETRAADAIAARGHFLVGVPGGSVASAFFPAIVALHADWRRVDWFWTDERAVPPQHPDSNFAVASRLLLVPARVPAERIHRMPGELPDLDQAARRASDELKSIAGDPPRLDLVVLGVGDDGHVASIFGNSTGRVEQPVIAVYDSPKPPARRLSLTLSVLADASHVIVAAFGASKARAMRRALHEIGASTPVAELLRRAPSSLVLLDRDAGLS
jgi:6-phosphogluconolactonase